MNVIDYIITAAIVILMGIAVMKGLSYKRKNHDCGNCGNCSGNCGKNHFQTIEASNDKDKQ